MNLYKNLPYLHPDKKREASASLERFQFEVGSILNYYSTRLPYTCPPKKPGGSFRDFAPGGLG